MEDWSKKAYISRIKIPEDKNSQWKKNINQVNNVEKLPWHEQRKFESSKKKNLKKAYFISRRESDGVIAQQNVWALWTNK